MARNLYAQLTGPMSLVGKIKVSIYDPLRWMWYRVMESLDTTFSVAFVYPCLCIGATARRVTVVTCDDP